MNLLLVCLYGVGLYAAYLAGATQLRTRSVGPHRAQAFNAGQLPRATLGLMLIIAIPTTLQFFFPAVLRMFERDYSQFVAGEWWRLVTPLVVQDGGVSDSIFNLVTLFFVGSVAEQRWGSQRCPGVFLVGGVVSEAIGFAWQPVGAGNSVANFTLAASVAVACLCAHPPRLALLMALLALGADMWLLFLKDIHGAAALVGAVMAIVLMVWEHGRWSRRS